MSKEISALGGRLAMLRRGIHILVAMCGPPYPATAYDIGMAAEALFVEAQQAEKALGPMMEALAEAERLLETEREVVCILDAANKKLAGERDEAVRALRRTVWQKDGYLKEVKRVLIQPWAQEVAG